MAKGHTRLSKKTTLHYHNKSNDKKLRLSELMINDTERNPRHRSTNHVSFPAFVDETKRTYRAFNGNSGKIGSHIFANNGHVTEKHMAADTNNRKRTTADNMANKLYCCTIGNRLHQSKQSKCNAKDRNRLSIVDVKAERKMRDDYRAKLEQEQHLEYTDLDDDVVVISDKPPAKLASVLIVNKSKQDDKDVIKMQNRVFGCKFEFSYTLPELGNLLCFKKRKDCLLARCFCCHKRKRARIEDRPSVIEDDDSGANLTQCPKIGGMPSCCKPESNSTLVFRAGEDRSPPDLLKTNGVKLNVKGCETKTKCVTIKSDTQRFKNDPKQKKSVKLEKTFNTNKQIIKYQPSNKEVINFKDLDAQGLNNNTRICQSTTNIPKKTLKSVRNVDNPFNINQLLYHRRSNQLHTLYQNVNYKILQSLTNLLYAQNKNISNSITVCHNTINNKEKSDDDDKKLLNSKVSHFSLTRGELNCKNDIGNLIRDNNLSKHKDYVQNILNTFNSPDGKKMNATDFSKAVFQAVLSQYSSTSSKLNKGKSTKRSVKSYSDVSFVRSEEFQVKNSPEASDIDMSPSRFNQMMDNIYSENVKKSQGDLLLEEDEIIQRTIRFQKLPPILQSDHTHFIRVYVNISNTYERLLKLEIRIKQLIKDLGVDCDSHPPPVIVKSRKSVVNDSNYSSTSYTITRDLKNPNLLYIKPPVDRMYKTCDCHSASEKTCMKIDFTEAAKYRALTESNQSCNTCLADYKRLIENLQQKDTDTNRSIYERVCDFFADIFYYSNEYHYSYTCD